MKLMRIAAAGVLVVSTLLFAASCGKKCEVCGKNSMNTREIFGVVVCEDCLNSIGDMF